MPGRVWRCFSNELRRSRFVVRGVWSTDMVDNWIGLDLCVSR
jgi:hypothetical protein